MSQHDRFDVALTQGNVMYLSMQQNWLATHVRDVDVPVVVDAEWAPGMSLDLLAVCTVLLADSRFARHVTHHGTPQEWLDGLRDRAPRATWIAVSLGAQGCVAWSKGRTVTVPTLAVDVQDGTGAGDAWHGAFVYAWSRGWPLEAVARFSNVAAALACRRLGARTALPHLAEVQALLALV
jgi:sugar/nucleoside kinase (ribokinase family)